MDDESSVTYVRVWIRIKTRNIERYTVESKTAFGKWRGYSSAQRNVRKTRSTIKSRIPSRINYPEY